MALQDISTGQEDFIPFNKKKEEYQRLERREPSKLNLRVPCPILCTFSLNVIAQT